jgi:hypothetical protein
MSKDKLQGRDKSILAAWKAWTKARYGWTADFAESQYNLYWRGIRDERLHDVTCVHCQQFIDLP